MKKFMLVLLAVLLLTSCGGHTDDVLSDESGEKLEIPYTSDGEYAGFSNLPEIYTAEDAARDGCYVVVSALEPNNIENDLGLVAGGETWEKFYEESQGGRDSYMRVAHFVDGKPYYTDLYYVDGEYLMFDLNDELGLVAYAPQKYLLELCDEINGREVRMYVLADRTDLTYREVEMTFASSSIHPYTDKKFFWLGFTTYYVYDGEAK